MLERNVERISYTELLECMDVSTHEQIARLAGREGFRGFVMYRNETFDSSCFGEEKMMACGDEGYFTYTIAKALVSHLGDVPSRFMYPIWFYDKETSDD